MWQETVRWACVWVVAVAQLFFLDGPFLTMGQRWVARRSHERNILLSMEVNFIALWLLFKYYMRWDPAPAPAWLEPPLTIFGALLVLFGATLQVWGKLRLGRWFSATFGVKEGHELVTDGPFAITRHPIYSGILLMLFGLAFAWDSVLTLLLALLLTMTLSFHAYYEEVLFDRHFGDAYRDYRRRVPKLVPFTRPGGTT